MPLRDLKLHEMTSLGATLQSEPQRRSALKKAPELLVAFKRLDQSMALLTALDDAPRIDYEARTKARQQLDERDQLQCARLRALWYAIEANAALLPVNERNELLRTREQIFKTGLSVLKVRRGERALQFCASADSIRSSYGTVLKSIPVVGGTALSLLQTICKEAVVVRQLDSQLSRRIAIENSTLGGTRSQASRTTARNAWIRAVLTFETLGTDSTAIAALNTKLLGGIRTSVARAEERKKRSLRRKKLREKRRAEREA